MELRKKILNLEDGLNIYSQLQKDEEAILIPFVISQYVTVSQIDELLPEYLADLRRNECKEALCIDSDQLTSLDYWMEKLVKMKNDMEMLGTKPMKEHGFAVTLLGFTPEMTMDLYRAIEQKVAGMVEMLKEVQRLVQAAPPSLYGNFFRYQKSLVDKRPIEAAHARWRMDVGVEIPDLLKDRQTLVVANFLKMKVLRFTQGPSKREIEKVDLDKVRPHLPYGYELPDDFEKCCARFRRFISWDGDILKIDYGKFGKYLFVYFYQLTPAERQAFIELDLMLDLINEDIKSLNQSDKPISVEDRIRHSIELLMKEQYDGEPLFNQQNHWQAVYRILVDKEYCRDSDFEGFDAFILKVMPNKVNKPYKKDSVKHISQTSFVLPFDRWKYDSSLSGNRKPYERMVLIATRFKSILEENGL